MKLMLDSSSSECLVYLVETNSEVKEYRWQSGRELARGLLGYLESILDENGLKLSDISGIGFYRGPGSFTGLRIGAATCNAISYASNIPVVGETGENWVDVCLTRLNNGENDKVILPDYGREARITAPRK